MASRRAVLSGNTSLSLFSFSSVSLFKVHRRHEQNGMSVTNYTHSRVARLRLKGSLVKLFYLLLGQLPKLNSTVTTASFALLSTLNMPLDMAYITGVADWSRTRKSIIFKFWSFLQSISANNVGKLLQLLGYYVIQTSYWGFPLDLTGGLPSLALWATASWKFPVPSVTANRINIQGNRANVKKSLIEQLCVIT